MTGMRVVVVASSLLLVACGTASTAPTSSRGSSAAGSPRPSASDVSGHDTGLELRKVLDAQPTAPGQCAASSSANAAPTTGSVTACASDGTVVYTLGPAVVTGTQWESIGLREDAATGAWQVGALLDPSGSSALTQATGELAVEDEPRNQIAFYLHGSVQSAPTVSQPVYGGRVIIASGLEKADAQQLVDDLTR